MHNIDIKEVRLLVEESFAEVPEFVRAGLQDGSASFVDKGRRGVPGLDLLSEDDLELVLVFGLDDGVDGGVDCVEHFLRELGLY